MGDLNLVLMCIAIVMCIFVSAFFSCSETVFMAANRYRISHLAKRSKAASRALLLLDEPEQLLGVVLVGNTVANILVSVLVTKVSFYLGADFGVMLATTVLVVFVLIFCEVIPKNVGVKYSESLALSLSGVLTLLKFMMMPLVRAVNACVRGLFCLVGANVQDERRVELTRDELHGVVKEETSGLSRSDQSMLLGVLSLDDLTVSDVMRPVSKLALLDIQLPWAEFLNHLLGQEATQIVIYRHSLDQVLGLLDIREVLRLMHRGPLNKAGLLYVLKPVVFVPLTAALKDQWSLLLWGKNKLILVIDEYGVIKGGLAKSDVANEVMGSIDRLRHDSSEQVDQLLQEWTELDGGVFVRDLNRLYDLSLPTDDAKTLSGFIIEQLDFIPQYPLCMSVHGVLIEVLKISDGTIQGVRIKKAQYRQVE